MKIYTTVKVRILLANKKILVLKDANSKERFCLSPAQGSSNSYTDGVNVSGGYAGSAMGVGAESSEGVTSLGGLDPAVLIARELMYRACEFTLNTNADSASANAIYFGTLNIITQIATSLAQSIVGTTSISSNPETPSITLAPDAPDAEPDQY